MNPPHAVRASVPPTLMRRTPSAAMSDTINSADHPMSRFTGFGDSAMRDYAPYCDRIAVARDLNSLREVVDQLIGKRRHHRGLA